MTVKLLFYFYVIAFLFAGTLVILGICSSTKPFFGIPSPASKEIDSLDRSITHRFLLIGDAGYPEQFLLESLERWAQAIPQKTTILFLGDNVYPNGIPAQKPEAAYKCLRDQIDVALRSHVTAIFIPGNHDWGGDICDSGQTLLRQAEFIRACASERVRLEPSGGTPGPALVAPDLPIRIIDSQWWFLSAEACKPGNRSTADARCALRAWLDTTKRRPIIVSHHPLFSHGPHGGYFSWKDHLFPLRAFRPWLWVPLPVVGSVYPLWRYYIGVTRQDLRSDRYSKFRDEMISLFQRNCTGRAIWISGHEHSLQVLEQNDPPVISLISGAGSPSKITEVGHGADTFFAHQHAGFMVLDFFTSQAMLLRVIEPGNMAPVFAMWL